MSRFLDTALGIHDWLAGLQIRQQSIAARIENGRLRFTLEHPVEGTLQADEPMPDQQMFQSHGIALRAGKERQGHIDLEVYDSGGIFDPIDGRVQGEHYSATHFAMLSAVLYRELKEEHFLDEAQRAIEFHLRTSPHEYYFSEWMYHWDFQNYAFLLTYKLLRDDMPAPLSREWARALLRWRTNQKNKLTNWAAMRAWAYLERYRMFGRPGDYVHYRLNLRTVAKARQADGCFDDNKNLSRPIQYHIFTVALLHRLLQLDPSPTVRRWFEAGMRYFVPFIDPDGDFNYLGRGQEQIFGYGAAVYALEAAYRETGDTTFLQLSDSIFSFLERHKADGYFPLVLNPLPDSERSGWYDYHHLTVYNAYLGAWLALAHLLRNSRPERSEGRRVFTTHWQPTRTVIVSRGDYFVVFFGGLPEYASEPAITPHHLWWKGIGRIFSSPGGPTKELHGKRAPLGTERNVWAPVALVDGVWQTPCRACADRFEFDGKTLVMRLSYGLFSLLRTVRFDEDAVEFMDEFTFDTAQTYEELRVFNLPLATQELVVDAQDGNRLRVSGQNECVDIVVGDSDFAEAEFETFERLKVARGLVEVIGKRYHNVSFRAGEQRKIQFCVRSGHAERSTVRDEGRLSQLPV